MSTYNGEPYPGFFKEFNVKASADFFEKEIMKSFTVPKKYIKDDNIDINTWKPITDGVNGFSEDDLCVNNRSFTTIDDVLNDDNKYTILDPITDTTISASPAVANSLVIFNKNQEEIVNIDVLTGKATFGPNYCQDEATTIFWEALALASPVYLKEENYKLQKQITELKSQLEKHEQTIDLDKIYHGPFSDSPTSNKEDKLIGCVDPKTGQITISSNKETNQISAYERAKKRTEHM